MQPLFSEKKKKKKYDGQDFPQPKPWPMGISLGRALALDSNIHPYSFYKKHNLCMQYVIGKMITNRPGVAGAVL